MNFLDGTYTEDGAAAAVVLKDGTAVPVKPRKGLAGGTRVTLGIRPEHVATGTEGMVEAGVDLIEPTGFGVIMHLSVHGLPLKVFTLDRSVMTDAATVRLTFPEAHLHIFDAAATAPIERDQADRRSISSDLRRICS